MIIPVIHGAKEPLLNGLINRCQVSLGGNKPTCRGQKPWDIQVGLQPGCPIICNKFFDNPPSNFLGHPDSNQKKMLPMLPLSESPVSRWIQRSRGATHQDDRMKHGLGGRGNPEQKHSWYDCNFFVGEHSRLLLLLLLLLFFFLLSLLLLCFFFSSSSSFSSSCHRRNEQLFCPKETHTSIFGGQGESQ